MKKSVLTWLVLGLAFFISACSKSPELIAVEGSTMGTTYHVKVAPSPALPDVKALQTEIDAALELVNNQMSTYRPDSELSRFNQAAKDVQIDVSPDTIKVVQEGVRLYSLTNGALDITLGPLVNLWGFGPDKRPTQSPTPAEISDAKMRTGIENIHIEGTKISKFNDGLYVDLSSIAKGFGVDVVASILDGHQAASYMVEIGGELRTKGTKPDGSAWRIAIEKPVSDGRAVTEVIEPGTIGMATSGDYRNYFEENGKRYSHLIDPRTGYPIAHTLASVTVLHPSCMVADGLATAMMVLGTEASLELAKREQLAIMLIEKQGDEFVVQYSDAFRPFVKSAQE